MSVVRRATALIGVPRYFHEVSLRGRVVLSQLPVAVTTLFVLLAASYHPAITGDPYFGAGIVLQAVLLAGCCAVPWHRLPYPAFWAIPLLDFVSVGLLRIGAGEHLAVVSLLAVLPAVWLVASNVAPAAAVVLSFVAPLCIVWSPVLAGAEAASVHALVEPLIIPVIIFGIAASIRVLTSSLEARQRQLETKDRELRAALAETTARDRLLNAMVESVGVGLLTVDAGGHDVLMNNRQRKNHLLAVPPNEPDPNEAQLLVFGPDRKTPLPADERPVRRAVLGESFSDQLIWLGAGAAQRAFSVSARAVRSEDGAFEGSIVAFSDVTELMAAIKAKDDFLANVSHELRTPLTSILGYLELALMEDSEMSDTVSTALTVSMRNATRLLNLVSDLLTTASGAVDIQPEDTCLTAVINAGLDSAAPRAAAAGITLIRELEDPLPAFIDRDRISQVLDNLLSNAIKYSPSGGTVTVRAFRSPGAVVCVVRDTGIGMSQAETEELFTRFFRAGSALRAAIPGIGLGLSITKEIIAAHGGTIEVQSTAGQGSTFTITLPAHRAARKDGLAKVNLGL